VSDAETDLTGQQLDEEPQLLKPLGQGTISRTMVRRVAVLVAVTAILLDAAAVAMARSVWMAGVDSELSAAQRSPLASVPIGIQQGPWASEIQLQVLPNGSIRVAAAFDRNSVNDLTQPQVDVLMSVRTDGRAYTVNLPGLGSYRVAAQLTPQGLRVVGVSMRGLSAAFGQLLLTEALFTIAAVMAAALVAAAVVRTTLRPLTMLAATATRVGTMRLDQGEVRLGRLGGSAVSPASEVGQVGMAFNHMLDNIEDALSARHRSEAKVRAFVADASHELRNPLAAIRGYAELLGRDRASLGPSAVAVDRIGVESRRMSTLVDEMLLLARLDEGIVMAEHRVDMTMLLVDAVADAMVAGLDHDWAVDVPEDPVTVMGDDNQLHEVVANLLGNARKHTPPGTNVLATLRRVPGPIPSPGSPEPQAAPSPSTRGKAKSQAAVTFAIQPADVSATSVPRFAPDDAPAHIVLTVSDDGPGIPAELQAHIFERFVRADRARTHDDEGSTGLGLAIVAGVIAAHGGRVDLDSVPGATCFTVLLPAAPAGTDVS